MQSHTPRIRVVALGLMKRPDGKVLVERGTDPTSGDTFYRALGGGIEFGETVTAALAREFSEELGIETVIGQQRAVIENIFTFDGKPGHEIVFIYELTPKDSAFYAQEAPRRLDGVAPSVCWRAIEDIAAEGLKIYPAGFAQLV